MEVDVAQHLANTYGDRAFVVARMCKSNFKLHIEIKVNVKNSDRQKMANYW